MGRVTRALKRFSPERLKQHRRDKKMSWDTLAAQAGESRAQVLHWAAGRRGPNPEQLQRLAAALGVRETDLLAPPAQHPTLRQLREEANMTQAELARLVGIPRSSYAELEAGKAQATKDTVTRISAALGREDAVAAALLSARTKTQHRHAQLRPNLTAAEAVKPVTATWLDLRIAQFAELIETPVDHTTNADEYYDRTGRAADEHRAGEAFLGPPDARWPRPLLYLNLPHLPDRAEADRVIAHELMHVRWPSYGHKQRGFDLAQNLLDQVPPPPS